MYLKELQRPLKISEIDFRVQSINKGGYATILAYKDARVDMNRLDEVVGSLNWKREHLHANHNCVVSIYDPEKQQWVSKEDTGTASFTEAEKGLASDSFKRACFNWGIGRELYDYPEISVPLKKNEWRLNEKKKDKWGNPKPEATWELKLKEWVWYSEFKDGEITFLAAKDGNQELRFKWGTQGVGEAL